MSGLPAATTIRVHVRLFAAYREAAGTQRLHLDLPTGSSTGAALDRLHGLVPNLRATPGLIAVNQEYVDGERVLRDGDEVALIPPVSGGC